MFSSSGYTVCTAGAGMLSTTHVTVLANRPVAGRSLPAQRGAGVGSGDGRRAQRCRGASHRRTNAGVVRMGNLPDGLFVPNLYNNEIWQYLNAVICAPTSVNVPVNEVALELYPNPTQDRLHITLPAGDHEGELRILDALGREVLTQQILSANTAIGLQKLSPGSYRCVLTTDRGLVVRGFVKE